MAVKGVFTSASGVQGDRVTDFRAGLLQVVPTGMAPFFALSSGMRTEEARDTIVTWFEENWITGRVGIVNNPSPTDPFVVDDASAIIPGHIFMVEGTGEYVFILSITGNSLTVERGFAGTSVAPVGPAPAMQRIGTAFEEGSSKPQAFANLGYPRFNYVQIFRNAWDVTGTAQAVMWHTGDQVARNKRDAALFHSEDIERSLWFGRKSIGVKNSKPFHTMDGLLAQIRTNVTAQVTNTDWDDLDTFVQQVFSRNIKGEPNERVGFCGNTVISTINKLARNYGTISLDVGATEFGLKILQWITPFGTINLVSHPMFNESPVWTKMLVLLHPGAVRIRYLRRTHEDRYDRDGTRAGVDADFGVWTTELTMIYMAEMTGGVFTGIDTAGTPA